jgi:uncharacterized protein (DUF1330 family)
MRHDPTGVVGGLRVEADELLGLGVRVPGRRQRELEATPADAERFGEYERQTLPLVIKYGGEPLARDTDTLPIEREDRPAIGVIIKFPDKQAVQAYFDSPEYAPLRAFRQSFTQARALVIEG